MILSFHANLLSDSKSPQVTRTLLSILAAVVWVISFLPPISSLPSLFFQTFGDNSKSTNYNLYDSHLYSKYLNIIYIHEIVYLFEQLCSLFCILLVDNLLVSLQLQITQECCEQYWKSPGGNTQQSTNYTATYLPSRKLFKLDEPDIQDTAGEAGASS